eukprot:CAMPEP_0177313494 /NCGR_PEP_ID=MMETSP0368-20130122/11436_1 /TAXON_ID=447022 ORGANISM="Scrippsiella hangoei-like, Strain SHHI-4" /NCGR_SAMPLE_ID=MMETSP0368 /ASSEMBLY_ACC=CAM_ASM_000363 /LENGTH=125 /DNA_ID=CAMNT_0018772591 /DNA_START=376 /DNA_END=754 /DNA_ORIENTATION=-
MAIQIPPSCMQRPKASRQKLAERIRGLHRGFSTQLSLACTNMLSLGDGNRPPVDHSSVFLGALQEGRGRHGGIFFQTQMTSFDLLNMGLPLRHCGCVLASDDCKLATSLSLADAGAPPRLGGPLA